MYRNVFAATSTRIGFFLIAAGACAWPAAARPTGFIREILVYPETPPIVELPKEIAEYIEKELGARPVKKDDYQVDKYSSCQDFIRCAVQGNFDGNGMDDDAVLIKTPDGKVSLAAVHGFADRRKHYVLVEELDGPTMWTTLSVQPVGRTSVSMAYEEPPKTKDLKNPGIVESELETCHTVLYYWENGEYHGVYRGR